jgi:hypothetical protein
VLGHATATMTMDLYGHLVDANLWQAAQLVGGPRGHLSHPKKAFERTASQQQARRRLRTWAFWVEPPIGIEPTTYALREGLEPSMAVPSVTPPLRLPLSIGFYCSPEGLRSTLGDGIDAD